MNKALLALAVLLTAAVGYRTFDAARAAPEPPPVVPAPVAQPAAPALPAVIQPSGPVVAFGSSAMQMNGSAASVTVSEPSSSSSQVIVRDGYVYVPPPIWHHGYERPHAADHEHASHGGGGHSSPSIHTVMGARH